MKVQRRIDTNEFGNWVRSVGGSIKATRLIEQKLECSESKAEKLAGGRYPSLPTPTEQMALAALMQRPRDVLFPLVAAKGKRAQAAS